MLLTNNFQYDNEWKIFIIQKNSNNTKLNRAKDFKSNNQTTNLTSNFVFHEEPSKRLTKEFLFSKQKCSIEISCKMLMFPKSKATWESAKTLWKVDPDLVKRDLKQK